MDLTAFLKFLFCDGAFVPIWIGIGILLIPAQSLYSAYILRQNPIKFLLKDFYWGDWGGKFLLIFLWPFGVKYLFDSEEVMDPKEEYLLAHRLNTELYGHRMIPVRERIAERAPEVVVAVPRRFALASLVMAIVGSPGDVAKASTQLVYGFLGDGSGNAHFLMIKGSNNNWTGNFSLPSVNGNHFRFGAGPKFQLAGINVSAPLLLRVETDPEVRLKYVVPEVSLSANRGLFGFSSTNRFFCGLGKKIESFFYTDTNIGLNLSKKVQAGAEVEAVSSQGGKTSCSLGPYLSYGKGKLWLAAWLSWRVDKLNLAPSRMIRLLCCYRL